MENIKVKSARSNQLNPKLKEAVLQAQVWQVTRAGETSGVNYVMLVRAALWKVLCERNAGPDGRRRTRKVLCDYLAEFDYPFSVVRAAASAFSERDNELFQKLGLPLVEVGKNDG